MNDVYQLERFLDAQQGVYESVVEELRSGRKDGHWMWYVFPQLAGLGRSAMAYDYGIKSLGEARAYCEHPVLGGRLRECTRIVVGVEGRSAAEIFGHPDDLKFRSSMTLFDCVAEGDGLFRDALAMYYGGVPDPLTLSMLD